MRAATWAPSAGLAPVRIVSAGRGRIELRVDADVVLERVATV